MAGGTNYCKTVHLRRTLGVRLLQASGHCYESLAAMGRILQGCSVYHMLLCIIVCRGYSLLALKTFYKTDEPTFLQAHSKEVEGLKKQVEAVQSEEEEKRTQTLQKERARG